MPQPNLDEINTLTTKTIMPGIVDDFFKNDPLLQFFKRNRYFPYVGGPLVQENFLYAPQNGDWYSPGGQFNITKQQTLAGLQFTPRYLYVNVTENQEEVEVIIRSPRAIMSRVAADLGNAALTMSAKLAVALYRHGQNVGAQNNATHINGLEEALTDGTNNTWSGVTFPSYGNQSRGDVSPALNSPTGTISSPSVAGSITYHLLEQSFQSCVIGSEMPVMGVTTPICMGYINESFQPLQRIDTTEPTIGFPGIKFKTATIVQSNYCPGQGLTTQDVNTLGALKPSSGETFWWLNPGGEGEDALIRLYMSSSPKYQFGFTWFKVAQDSTMVAGQILFSGTVTVRSPRLMRCLYAITG